ncbi:MAG: DUF4097 family beta strand repeat-containing protein [Saprospiraceae bacterium]
MNNLKHLIWKKHFFLMLVLLLAIVAAGTSQTNNEFTIPLKDPSKRGKLTASINSGSITVKGTARKDILVRYTSDAEKDNKNVSKDGLKRVSGGNVDLSASEDDNNVKVISGSWNEELQLEIEIPSNFDVKMHTYNSGDLKIANVSGAIDLNNYNGGIFAENIKGSVVATTYNDDIKVTFDEVKGDVPMAFSTYNGDIDITFPANVKSSMKFKTDRGDIYTGFDVDIKSSGPVKKEESANGVYKVVVNQWKQGNINGGGPEMTFKTYNGDIYIRKK